MDIAWEFRHSLTQWEQYESETGHELPALECPRLHGYLFSSRKLLYGKIFIILGLRSAPANHIFSQISSEWAPTLCEVPHEQVCGHPQGWSKEAIREKSLRGYQGD